jgi:hypothetical protein
MDNSTKNALIILGTAIAVLFVFRRKRKSEAAKEALMGGGNKLSAPATASEDERKKIDNAHVALDAMRNAIEAGESSDNLNKLNRILATEYGVKVYPQKDGTLMVCDKSGASILKG